jgi:beta-galactosidase GanA
MNAASGRPHLERCGAGQRLMVDGKPFVMLAGEVHNSSASSLAYMEPIWERMVGLHLNTLIVPLYWELLEPAEGQFDMTLVDGLIAGARAHGPRLVFLWFASWKNATSSYIPPWVKADVERYPRMQGVPGQNSHAITCFSESACRADAAAFAAVMGRIGEIDGEQHTVLAMQVENEVGVLGTPRDRCPAAEAAFAEPVPEALTAYLHEHREGLVPALREVWEQAGSRRAGGWQEVFVGWADEVFMAWHTARYVDRVAAGGKGAYDLPMVANAWLIQSEREVPGQYPSGGPVHTMLDVWKAAAPHIDILAPDIYLPYFRRVCADYTRADNPLFIPEARRDARAASAVLYAIGAHDALCYAPFGIDDLQVDHPLRESYGLLARMMPVITELQGQGRMAGLLQQADHEQWVTRLGGYYLRSETTRPLEPERVPGGALILSLGPDEFVLAGRGVDVQFSTTPAAQPDVEFLWLETGTYAEGQWVPGRRLNGDETAHGSTVRLGDELTVCRVRLNGAAVPIRHQQRW